MDAKFYTANLEHILNTLKVHDSIPSTKVKFYHEIDMLNKFIQDFKNGEIENAPTK